MNRYMGIGVESPTRIGTQQMDVRCLNSTFNLPERITQTSEIDEEPTHLTQCKVKSSPSFPNKL